MTWPTSRPGYPRDAERDGWHWLMIGHGVGHPFPMLWCADGEMWEAGDDGYVAAADISTRWNYLGPCYTQADLDAAVQAERADAANVAEYWPSGIMTGTQAAIARAIRARGPTSALDAALAQARREGMLAAAEIVKGMRKCPFDDPKYAPGPTVPCPVCGDKGDDASAEVHCSSPEAAIRSAAAGEEGK